MSFSETWEELVEFADSRTHVRTLGRGNRNEIRTGDDTIEVKNTGTGNWRSIEKGEFEYAYQRLQSKGTVTLDDVEPELAGKKSMTLAILARGLNLEYDNRPITVHA